MCLQVLLRWYYNAVQPSPQLPWPDLSHQCSFGLRRERSIPSIVRRRLSIIREYSPLEERPQLTVLRHASFSINWESVLGIRFWVALLFVSWFFLFSFTRCVRGHGLKAAYD